MQNIEHIGASAAVADDADLGRDPRGASANPLSQVLGLFTRTGGFYARSWGDYLDREPGELPVARPTLALATEAFFDEIVLTGFRLLRSAPDAARLEWITREVIAALEFYGQQGWLEKSEGFFAAPPALTDVTVRTVSNMGRTYERMFFDSGYEPHAGEPGRERWLSYTGNNREYGLMLRHRQPRPWLVCVHGAEMGRAALDPTLFRAWHLHSDLGLNVVLPVLPMHGPRARGLPKGAAFPSEDVLNDVHGAAQAVWDIRRLLSWIRSQQPDSMIGLNGISLGGFLTSLVASLDDGLTCAILGVPAVDLVELVGRHAGLSGHDALGQTMRRAKPIGRMISPFALTPRVPMQGRFIYAGIADRLVHPRDQVARLWQHWGRPQINWYSGGHTGFFRSRPVQRFIDDALVQSGLVDPARISRER
ncbi:MAG: alpha/beta hydrolase family protein [Mycobacterium sp.]|uniref:alpha/beta hydrolase family protein n=1 Tax=Mycobacterium sp. TaxID=1785 RepID=UPI003F9BF8F6